MKSKFSDPPQDFLLTFFSDFPHSHFGRRGVCYDITKSAGSQTNKKPSDNDNITAEFYKNVYQMNYLQNNFRMGILRKKKVLEKHQIGLRQILVLRLPSRKKVLVIAVKNYKEADFKVS